MSCVNPGEGRSSIEFQINMPPLMWNCTVRSEHLDLHDTRPAADDGGSFAVTVPATHLIPFSRVAVELLPEGSVGDSEAHIPLELLIYPEREIREDAKAVMIDISMATTMRIHLQPHSSPEPVNQMREVEKVQLLKAEAAATLQQLFRSAFICLRQYQTIAQRLHFLAITSASLPSDAATHPLEDQDPALQFLRNLSLAVRQILNEQKTNLPNMGLPLYLLGVLEVLDCPLLSRAIADYIVEEAVTDESSDATSMPTPSTLELMASLILH